MSVLNVFTNFTNSHELSSLQDDKIIRANS